MDEKYLPYIVLIVLAVGDFIAILFAMYLSIFIGRDPIDSAMNISTVLIGLTTTIYGLLKVNEAKQYYNRKKG